jgi:hypothetical protein
LAKFGGTNVRRARLRNRDQADSFSGIGERGDEASANADGRTFGDIGRTAHGCWRPTRIAGIFSFLCAAESASKSGNLFGYPLSVTSSSEWSEGVRAICDELRREGTSFLQEISQELRAALNDNEEILLMSEHTNPSSIHVILMVVGAILKLPRQLEPISATVTAILLKQGLRNFCLKAS